MYFVEHSQEVAAVVESVKAADLSGNPASATSGGWVLPIESAILHCHTH